MTWKCSKFGVRHFVIHQRGLMGKRSSASRTIIRFRIIGLHNRIVLQFEFVMDFQAMFLKAHFVLKDSFACIARVDFVFRMFFFVQLQFVLCDERVAAFVADERSFSGVESHVSGEMVFELKKKNNKLFRIELYLYIRPINPYLQRLSAYIAHETPDSAMNEIMFPH